LEELTPLQILIAKLSKLEDNLQALDNNIPVGMLQVFDDAVGDQVLQYAIFVVVQEIFEEYLRSGVEGEVSITQEELEGLRQRAMEHNRQIAERLLGEAGAAATQGPKSPQVSEDTI
jgi:hypothetical protein